MYVIERKDQGGGLLQSPPLNGWTKDLRKARTFATREEAAAECCPDNERPVAVADLCRPPRGV